jgi:hypothetical protein
MSVDGVALTLQEFKQYSPRQTAATPVAFFVRRSTP